MIAASIASIASIAIIAPSLLEATHGPTLLVVVLMLIRMMGFRRVRLVGAVHGTGKRERESAVVSSLCLLTCLYARRPSRRRSLLLPRATHPNHSAKAGISSGTAGTNGLPASLRRKERAYRCPVPRVRRPGKKWGGRGGEEEE